MITYDKDFGELVFKRKMRVSGIILLRVKPRNISCIYERILNLLNSEIELKNNFVVIEEDKIRVRKML
ncbi:MAG: DUF5615 family PIN-like protein [Thermodesulforhabdaceae bacterium]